jgi:hypothetical protein
MQDLFSSGHVIDLVIAIMALEVIVVWGWMQRRDALPWPMLMSGLCLLVAWRFAHGGAHWMWVALALSSAGAAHAVDLWRRWSAP